MYLLLLLIGSIGFIAMTLLGFSHGGTAHAPHAGGAHGHIGGHGAAHAGGHSHAHAGHHASTSAAHSSQMSLRYVASMLLLSPLDIFSLCLGAGLAGLALQTVVTANMLPWMAVIGALFFCLCIERPFLKFAMKFVSKPCEGLDGIVAHTAEAVTNFDAQGRGLVLVSIDDQTVQLLATLDSAELHRGVHVNKGDEVVVTSVDSAKNSCQVSKEL